MNPKILLLAVTVAFLSSCTTSYKTGQTPDDVYYSPVRPAEEYVQTDRKDEDRRYRSNDDEYYEDQYLRMKVRNRYRWSDLDDPYYYSSRYNYTNYNWGYYSNPWSPSTYWNNHYNPYYQGTVIMNPQTTVKYSGPRTFNLNTYNNSALTNGSYSNPKFIGTGNNSTNTNNTYNAPRNSSSNNGSNSGNILRDIFRSNSSSSGSTTPSTNSSSTNSSSGSSSGGSTPAPVRRF